MTKLSSVNEAGTVIEIDPSRGLEVVRELVDELDGLGVTGA